MNDAAPRAPTPAAPTPAWRRIDLFALLVRFQSVIGLVRGGDRRRHFLAAQARPHPVSRARQHGQYRARRVSETGIIAVGMTFVIITAGIDLSVGALLSLSSVLDRDHHDDRRLGADPDDPVRRRLRRSLRRGPGRRSRPDSGSSRSS